MPEGGGNALLAFERAPEAGPALNLTVLGEAPTDGLHQLVGDDGDKQVTGAPLRGLVEDGAQARLVFEQAKHLLILMTATHVADTPEVNLAYIENIRAEAQQKIEAVRFMGRSGSITGDFKIPRQLPTSRFAEAFSDMSRPTVSDCVHIRPL